MTKIIKIFILTFSLVTIGHAQKQTAAQQQKNVHYKILWNQHYKTVQLNKSDSAYFNMLTKRFKYKESTIIYSLTDLKTQRGGKIYNNLVYQNTQDKSQLFIDLKQINKNNDYLVANIQAKKIGRPGTGGISYHPTESKKHILCLNGQGNSNGISIEENKNGGFPTPNFTLSTISWYYDK